MIQGALHYSQVLSASLPRFLYYSTLGAVTAPRRSYEFFCGVLNSVDITTRDTKLKSLTPMEFLTQVKPSFSLNTSAETISLDARYIDSYFGGTNSLLEIAFLANVVKVADPKLIFEIGTFRGRTTRLFSLNSSPDCRIVTVDLPQIAVKHTIGEAFKDTPERGKITQLYADSTTSSFEEYHGKCDFVWVDACHDYHAVVRDSEHAFRLVKESGVILWHDYRHSAWWSGVTRRLREISSNRAPIYHIQGTTIASMLVQQS